MGAPWITSLLKEGAHNATYLPSPGSRLRWLRRPATPAGKQVTRLPLRNSDLMSVIRAGGLASPFGSRSRSDLSTDGSRPAYPTGDLRSRTRIPYAALSQGPGHGEMSIRGARPLGQYPTLSAGGDADQPIQWPSSS